MATSNRGLPVWEILRIQVLEADGAGRVEGSRAVHTIPLFSPSTIMSRDPPSRMPLTLSVPSTDIPEIRRSLSTYIPVFQGLHWLVGWSKFLMVSRMD